MEKFKKILKSIFSFKLIILVIVIVLIIFIILSSGFYFITIDDGEWEDAEFGNPSSYTEHVSVSGETGLAVSKSDLKTTALKGLKYTDEQIASMSDEEVIEKLQINRKLKKSPKVKSLDEVTQAELLWCMNDVYSKYLDKPEELEKLLNAEIITQYPDLGDAEGKLNGIIKFERHKEDGSSEFLTYVDSGTFDKYVNDGDSKALDYFTLDDTGNVVIASINTTTETLGLNDSEAKISDFTANLSEENKNGDGSYKKVTKNVSKQTIYYKNYVQDYTLPFNYLWSLLIIGEDKEFVMELAELAENSEITISIYDNITTNTNTDVYTYKKETRTDTYVRVTPSTTYGIKNVPTKGYWWPADKLTDAGATIGVDDWKNDADYETDETEYKITHTVKSDINAPTIALTKANVWIVDYSVEYTYKEAEVVSDDTNSKEEEDTDFVLDSDASGDSDSNSALLNCEHAQEMTRKTRKYIEDHKPDTTTSRSSFSITGTSSGTNSKKDNSVFDSVIKEDVKTDTNSNLLHPSKKDDTTKSDSSSSKEDVPTTVPEPLLTVLPSYVRCDKYKHKIDRKQTTTSTTTQQSYVAQTPVSNPKDDKDADTDNFVKILCNKKHKKAKNYLTDGTTTSWLWEIMSVNCSDKLIDLTKYLFYKATGTNFGKKEYEYTGLEPPVSVDYSKFVGDYIVKTNDPNAAPVVNDKLKLKAGLEVWLRDASTQKANALSIVDKVFECQEKYNVNAIFIYAFLRDESGIGSANSTAVKQNNWGSWNVGASYPSPQENIETIAKGISTGSFYFTKGNISVASIGKIYCPNEPAHPAQGDLWIETVQKFMTQLYGAMGISVSTETSGGTVAEGGVGTIGVYQSGSGSKFNLYLQGSGAPWANEDYGNDHSMAKAGCGPTAASIISSGYNASINPSTFRAKMIQLYGTGNHSSATLIEKAFNQLVPGVKTETTTSFDENKIRNCLKSGGQVWLVVSHCKYTSGAHCIALIDYNSSNDQVYVAHGTAKSRPYGWDSLSYIKSYFKSGDGVLYIGGK